MKNEPTINKMRDMRLTAMAEAFSKQMTDSSLNSLAFEERMGLLVDAEWSSRKNNRLKKLLKSAGFDQTHACIADINYRPSRKLDQTQILRLAGCTYIEKKHNIIIMGAAGSGKSYVACAFGIAACQNFHTVKYIRLSDLLIELDIARNEGSYKKLMNQYRKFNWMSGCWYPSKRMKQEMFLRLSMLGIITDLPSFVHSFRQQAGIPRLGKKQLLMRLWIVLFMIHTSLRSIPIRMMMI